MRNIPSKKKEVKNQKLFFPIYNGILDYGSRGDLSIFEFGIYAILHGQCDFSSGKWWGSAKRIAASFPRGANLRKIQRAIARLVDIGLLKTFHRQGIRGNFGALINKFRPRFGALIGMQLNATKSTSFEQPVYEACAEDALITYKACAVDGRELSHLQEVKNLRTQSKNEEKRGAAAKPGAAPDPSAQLYLDQLKRLAGETTDRLVQRMLGEDTYVPTFFGDIRKRLLEEADDAAINFKDGCNVYRAAMRCAEWIVTPLELVAENPIGPINEQRLQELIAEDPGCIGGYMQPDGSAWMEFEDGSMYIPPDGVDPVWHPIDDPLQESENHPQNLEMAMGDSGKPSSQK